MFEPVVPWKIREFGLKWIPDGNDGDDCDVRYVTLYFFTPEYAHYAPAVKDFIDFKLKSERPRSWTVKVPFEEATQPPRTWKSVKEFFEIRPKGYEPPPTEIYALQAEPPLGNDGGALRFQISVADGLQVFTPSRREFLFPGAAFEQFPEVEGKWPKGWIPGSERCVQRKTLGGWLKSIEFFADGTVRASDVAPITPRGYYESTKPWRQVFHTTQNGVMVPVGKATTFLAKGLWFYSGGERAIELPRPGTVAVPNDQGEISSSISPKILDEDSAGAEGRIKISVC